MATILSQGDIAVVQYSSDGSGDTGGETFSFVLLADVDASTVINFTDSNFNTAGEVTLAETTWTWTSGAALPAGTVVTFTDAVSGDSNNEVTSVSVGSFTSNNPSGNFATTGDQLFIYQGTVAGLGDAPSLLFGAGFNDPDNLSNPVGTDGWNVNASTDGNESQLPTSLIGHEVAFSPEVDNGYYTGPTSGTPETIYAAIQDPENWTTDNVYQGVQSFSFDLICFAAGTRISVPSGVALVEDLRIGDMVVTSDGRAVPVRWIGRQGFAPVWVGGDRALVRMRAGALGGGLPEADLTVTADHGMILDGMVVNASALVNHDTITFVPASALPAMVTVYHIETEAHDVILAEGAATESFIDYVGRAAFDNHDEYLALYGAERLLREAPLPRVTSARLLPPSIRARLGAAHSTGCRVAA